MNGNPHTHRLQVNFGHIDGGILKWKLTYGDQTARVWHWVPGSTGRLFRKINKVVARHDKHSRKAHEREAIQLKVEAYNERLIEETTDPIHGLVAFKALDEWGSELLKKA